MTEKLVDLILKAKPITSVEPGDFEEVIENGVLYVRQDVYDIDQQCGIRGALELYSLVESFPTTYITGLGWSYEELEKAREKLKKSLESYVDPRYFEELPERKFADGARPLEQDELNEEN